MLEFNKPSLGFLIIIILQNRDRQICKENSFINRHRQIDKGNSYLHRDRQIYIGNAYILRNRQIYKGNSYIYMYTGIGRYIRKFIYIQG